MKPSRQPTTENVVHPKGTRLLLKQNREAVVLENRIKDSDYLVAYKKSNGDWSNMNIKSDMIESLWVDPIEVEFLANIIAISPDSVGISCENRLIVESLSTLKDKRINVKITERK